MHVSALIAAGGRGSRFGAAQPKQFLSLGGRSILERSVDAFRNCLVIDDLVVAVPPEVAENPPASLLSGSKPIEIVALPPVVPAEVAAAALTVEVANTEAVAVVNEAKKTGGV